MLEHAGLSVDVGDRGPTRRRVRERRVVGHQAEVVFRDLDLPQVHRLDRPVGHIELVGLAGPVVGDRERVSVGNGHGAIALVLRLPLGCHRLSSWCDLSCHPQFSHRRPVRRRFWKGWQREHRARRRHGAKARCADVVLAGSGAGTTFCPPRSASARIRGGGEPWWTPCEPARPTVSSTSRPGRASSARQLVRRYGCAVVGLDQSRDMLDGARSALAGRPELAGRIELVEGEAERAAVRRRASSTTSRSPTSCATWTTRARRSPSSPAWSSPGAGSPRSSSGCPTRRFGDRSGGSTPAPGCRRSAGAFGGDWYEVGRFLGPSIEACIARWPLARQLELWERRGSAVRARAHEPRRRGGDLGHAGWLTSRDRPAFYALRPGGWRDLVTILHPPYTAWHLSYVAFGAVAAPDAASRSAVGDAGRLLPRGRGCRARAGRAQRAPASDAALRSGPGRPGRDRRSPGRSRSASPG